ncbi:hypothetical protein PENPOL_c010G02454 [Penicillium polonicum]|uniref:Uncharacterized protein n=1 Tax=Penicillium polonicum TaxID=60169 RepID=A0A1V6NE97_PENPO|nr:hypothetical protein PENPOL_c010G02454 [Penicillium polonicum]
MADRKRALRSGKAGAGSPSNGFTTERSVGGERRSIRHYHDGRVSQREAPIPGPVRKLTKSTVTSRANSASTSTILKPKVPSKPKEPEYQSPTDAEIEKLAGAVTNLFHPERTTPFPKPPPRVESPEEEGSQSWSSDGSYGMITPPFPVASPTPEDSPELMSTEVFPPPVTRNPRASGTGTNSISKQWADMGGKNRIRHSDLHD